MASLPQGPGAGECEAEVLAAPVSSSLSPAAALRLGYAFHGCLCTGFFGLGVVLCMLGPTLLDLGDQTGSTVQEMSLVFTARSGFYLVGSVVGGLLLERLENHCLMLTAAMYLVAVGAVGIPLCTAVWSMCCFMACAGLAMGLLDTGANVVTLRLWGNRAEPFVQSLHASFAVGALSAPLLAEQFISHGGHAAAVAAACAGTGNSSLPGAGAGLGEAAGVSEGEGGGEGKPLVWAFWLSALFMLPAAAGLTWIAPQFPGLARSNLLHVGGGAEAGQEGKGAGAGAMVAHPRLLLGLGLLIFGLCKWATVSMFSCASALR